MSNQSEPSKDASSLHSEVEDRFGVLPNFFRLAPDAPEVTENLWGFARFGYLDNPLPSLFKERLFVYLSQFCEVRYCISRHVGFLVGLGRPSGDNQCSPETVEQVVRLIRRPFPKGEALNPHLEFCTTCDAPLPDMPEAESFAEEAIFACAAHLFLQTPEANRCLEALRRALGGVPFQHLLVFITFVRTAHFWTKLHPELHLESDIAELLNVHEALAECVLHDPEDNDSETTQILLNELVELRKEREQAELLRVTLASIGDAVIATDSLGQITTLNAIAEELTGWTNEAACGKSLDVVFRIVNEETGLTVENPATKALREGVIVGLANHTILIARDGTERFIDDSAAPIRDADGNVIGSVLVFRDISERRQAERGMKDARNYAESIVDTVREPLIVLDDDLRVRSANRSFYQTFQVTPQETEGRRLYDLGSGQWNIPGLRSMLEEVLPQNSVVEEFEVESEFPGLGPRTMRLNARKLQRAGNETGLVLLAVEDITERKRGEEGLRRLASVVESSNDAIITKSLDGIIQHWNAAAERIFGYSAEEAVGRHISLLIPEERIDEEDDIIAKLRADTRVEHFDTVRRRKDGQEVHVSLTISPLKDSTGEVIGASKIARDITDRKAAHDALRETESELREARSRLDSTLAAAEIGTWEFDPVNNVVKADRNLKLMFGIAPEEQGSGSIETYLEAIHSDDKDTVAAAIKETLAAGVTYETEYRLRGSDNSVRWVVARGRVERDESGQAVRLPGVVVDISDRKRFEKALQESEERHRLALDAADLGSWHVDPDEMTLQTDQRFREIFGVTAEHMTFDDAVSIIHPADRERVLSAVDAAMRPVNPEPYASEYRVVHPDNTIRWVLAKGRGNFVQTGKVNTLTSFDGTVMDITDQRKTQDDLREVAARLSEAARRKDEFLATLAHELRNPLAPIRTGLEAMKLARDDPATVEEIRCTMERQAQQLITLVDDLLDVSRITKGKLALRKCRVKLAEVIQSAVEASRPFIAEADHKFTLAIPDHSIHLNADPHRLTQVLSNLLNNSTKYTPEGGHIWLSAEREGNDVVISVRDDGIGIPEDMLERIFEMFSQIDRPIEKGYTGLGIGLTLVKSLVEMHGGTIEVRSEGQNRGSEFCVRLPILVESADETPSATQPENQADTSTKRKVLVVDDNKAAATMLGMVVKMLGNDVRNASDGREAIEVAATFLPDVILMDIGMPHMNGYEAARHIRKQEWGRSMFLVALTGWGQEEDKQKTKDAGFDHHLVKPAEPSDLEQVLSRLDRSTTH